MDFSGFVLIPLAALITAGWIVGAALLSKHRPGFRAPFLLSYALGIMFMERWHTGSWRDVGMFVVTLLGLVFSVAAGCLIGGVPAFLIISIGTRVRRRLVVSSHSASNEHE